jgi:membrane-associated phospholipid phosphatase
VNFRLLLRVLVAASAAIAAGIVAPCAGAQNSRDDSAVTTRPWLTKSDAVVGALAVLATVAITPLDGQAARKMQEERFQQSEDLQSYARQLSFLGGPGPFLVGAGLFTVGHLSRMPRVADAGLHMTEAVLLAASITGLGKGISGRALPNVNLNNPDDFQFFRGFHQGNGGNGPFVSFPSGHAAASFAMATVITGEVDRWHPGLTRIVGPVAYGGAGLVGLARMYQNVHWASDLPVAAAIGTWSGMTIMARTYPQRQRSEARARDLPAGLVDVLRATSVVPIAGHGAALSWSIPLELGSPSHGH